MTSMSTDRLHEVRPTLDAQARVRLTLQLQPGAQAPDVRFDGGIHELGLVAQEEWEAMNPEPYTDMAAEGAEFVRVFGA